MAWKNAEEQARPNDERAVKDAENVRRLSMGAEYAWREKLHDLKLYEAERKPPKLEPSRIVVLMKSIPSREICLWGSIAVVLNTNVLTIYLS